MLWLLLLLLPCLGVTDVRVLLWHSRRRLPNGRVAPVGVRDAIGVVGSGHVLSGVCRVVHGVNASTVEPTRNMGELGA